MEKYRLVPMTVFAVALLSAPQLRAQVNDNCNSGSTCVDAINSGSGLGISVQSSGAQAILGVDTNGTAITGNSLTSTGVLGESSSGHGVEGDSSSSIGVKGVSSGYHGVYGTTSDSRSTSAGVIGVNTGGGYGVYGSGTLYAGYFSGNLQVTGTPYCSGCTAFTNNSDIRLKKNVKPLEGALDRLLQLHGVTFEWKDPEAHGNHQGMQRGFIAQEVEKVIPEWVGVDKDGFKTLNLTGIESLTVESIRSLKTENDALRTRSLDLEERVRLLEAGRRPMISGFGEGGIGLGLLAMAGTVVFTRRKRSDSQQTA